MPITAHEQGILDSLDTHIEELTQAQLSASNLRKHLETHFHEQDNESLNYDLQVATEVLQRITARKSGTAPAASDSGLVDARVADTEGHPAYGARRIEHPDGGSFPEPDHNLGDLER